MLKYIEPDRIYFKWEDKRQINGNEGRNVSCTSKHVEWTTEGQFWVPRIDVWDVIELVGLLFVYNPASEASYGIGSREGENSVVSDLTPLRGWHQGR